MNHLLYSFLSLGSIQGVLEPQWGLQDKDRMVEDGETGYGRCSEKEEKMLSWEESFDTTSDMGQLGYNLIMAQCVACWA